MGKCTLAKAIGKGDGYVREHLWMYGRHADSPDAIEILEKVIASKTNRDMVFELPLYAKAGDIADILGVRLGSVKQWIAELGWKGIMIRGWTKAEFYRMDAGMWKQLCDMPDQEE